MGTKADRRTLVGYWSSSGAECALLRAVTPLSRRIPGMRGLLTAAFLGLTPVLAGCLGAAVTPYALPAGESITVLYVMRYGWHTPSR
jgi:hypothetical protein